MPFELISEHLDGIKVIKTVEFKDERGSFIEQYRKDMFSGIGIHADFVQENHSISKKGVLRGLHFQWDPPMGKLMRVISGNAFLAAVDIRKGSPTLGKWFGLEVSSESRIQVWAPPGFARGFCALSDSVEIQYLCSGTYNNKGESGIRWNDPDIKINWPVKDPIISEKDNKAQNLSEWLNNKYSENFIYKR
ncbi:MAG: dTDP-4-dehydrorhamnose 3,5-epimerase [Acidobacteriota bacterium]